MTDVIVRYVRTEGLSSNSRTSRINEAKEELKKELPEYKVIVIPTDYDSVEVLRLDRE